MNAGRDLFNDFIMQRRIYMLTEIEMLSMNRAGWNEVAEQFYEGTFADLKYGSYGPHESELHLLGDVASRRVLEVGCGSGHTLEYLANRGAEELWGIDISSKQLETARTVTAKFQIPIYFLESPMEEMRGIPSNHFDLAISIFALGWTVNLNKTVSNIYKSLKPGGVFVFTWEHPVYSLLNFEDGKLYFRLPYASEQVEKHDSWRSVPIVMTYRRMSTFINALISSGFVLDRVIEETRIPENDISSPEQWYSAEKARMMPPSFTIKCHKPNK